MVLSLLMSRTRVHLQGTGRPGTGLTAAWISCEAPPLSISMGLLGGRV